MQALGLTDRQADVLAHLLEGKSNKQICRELDLAEATVKVHVRAILRVLGVNSRTEAMVAAARLGFNIASSSVSDESA
jgi:DNA-binding NarL/FixJ family response regulator